MSLSPALPIALGTAALAVVLCSGGGSGPREPATGPSTPTAPSPSPAPATTAPATQGRLADDLIATPAGQVHLGDALDRLPAGLERRPAPFERCSEEGCEQVPAVALHHDDALWATALPGYDLDAGAWTDRIGELHVATPRLTTDDGLSAGMTVMAFYRACPPAKALYTYVSDTLFLSCPKHPKMQFILPRSAYKGKADALGGTDLHEVPRSTVDIDAKVERVRLF